MYEKTSATIMLCTTLKYINLNREVFYKIYIFFLLLIMFCINGCVTHKIYYPISIESDKEVASIDIKTSNQIEVVNLIKKTPIQYYIDVGLFLYEERSTRRLRELLINQEIQKKEMLFKETSREFPKYGKMILMYTYSNESPEKLKRLKSHTTQWSSVLEPNDNRSIKTFNIGSYVNNFDNYVVLYCGYDRSKNQCDIIKGNYEFESAKGDKKFGWEKEYAFDKAIRKASNFDELKNVGINLWCEYNPELAKDPKVYSSTTKKAVVNIKNLKVSGIPDGFDYFIINNYKDGLARIKLTSKLNKFTFSIDSKIFGIEQEFNYLIPDFVKKRIMKIRIEEGSTSKNYTLDYYDASLLMAEIDRLKSLGNGYIRLTANMDNVDVYINGIKQGSIKNNKPFVAKLIEGQHKIQVKKDFFGSKAISVIIEPDDAFAYHFNLKPSGNLAEEMGEGKIVQSTGELVVVTTQNDLSVQINGQTIIPPFKLPNISSGVHKMKIKGPKNEKIIDVIVNENKKSLVDLDELY